MLITTHSHRMRDNKTTAAKAGSTNTSIHPLINTTARMIILQVLMANRSGGAERGLVGDRIVYTI